MWRTPFWVTPTVADHEQCIALTADFRLIQKRKGHRYSVDDMLVAHLACQRAAAPERVLDLGCGLGSVLLITAWARPGAEFVGLEALDEHVQYAQRNIQLNHCQGRARIVGGDMRDDTLVTRLGKFDLVTGSPPYFDPAAGTLCKDPARAAAHFELRGGVEAYAHAAGLALGPGGLFVCCAGAEPDGRARDALARENLGPAWEQPVVPRQGRPPFLTLLVGALGWSGSVQQAPPLVLRDVQGRRTPEHLAIRSWTGL